MVAIYNKIILLHSYI